MPRFSAVLAAPLLLALTSSPALAQAQGPQPADIETERYKKMHSAGERAVALCSGLWSGGLSMDIIDSFNPPLPQDEYTTTIDNERKIVSIAYDEAMPPRIVGHRDILGCVQAPPSATEADLAQYAQIDPALQRPDFDDQAWPMGDVDAAAPLSGGTATAINTLVEAAFNGQTYLGNSWSVLIVKDGKIVAERYAPGYDMHSAAQTHSAAKTFASSFVGIGVRDYGLDIDATPALEGWSAPGDPRGRITVRHLLRMASGLYGEGTGSALLDIYRGGGAVAQMAVANMPDTLPNTRFVYNPPDTNLAVRAVREAVNDDASYLTLPFTQLFWKIGMTRTTPTTDWNGDFLLSGQTYSSARDFARFGLMILNEGNWQGEQVLPADWVEFLHTPGPAQPPGPRGYGAQFWLYGGVEGLPEDTFAALGGGGNHIVIVPSEDLVVVRRGNDGPGGSFEIQRFTKDVIDALNRD